MEKKTPPALDAAIPLLQNPGWYRATTLAERVAAPHTRANEHFPEALENREKAQRRLQRWKEQSPFDQGTFFADRLTLDGLTERELLMLLAEPAEALQARLPITPDWLVQLQQAFADLDRSGNFPLPSRAGTIHAASEGLLAAIHPLLHYGLQQLDIGIQALITQYPSVPFDPQMTPSFLFFNLTSQILPKLSRTIVLELNVARLEGRLSGETAEKRFQSYMYLLRQPENLLALLEEYNVLARQVVLSIERWVAYSLEFLGHLCADWQAIRDAFSPGSDPGVLTEAVAGAGDTHRGGRSVMLLKFRSGLRLVYKPKSLAIDIHFQELLTWLNTHGQQPSLRTLKLIDRGKYGWSEFVAVSSCQSEEEVARFYERQGAYLALLYVLEAADFHHENVIAAGEHPLLIDLEALFHPRIHLDDLSGLPAQDALNHSVLRIGLLPIRLWSDKEHQGIDISGLGGQEGQFTPRPVPMYTEIGTDQMRLVREQIQLDGGHNRPKLKDQGIETLGYCEQVISGFTRMYQLLITHRDELLTELLPRFAHDEIRFIARATGAYTMLLTESFHPNMLRDALQRDRCFDRLWFAVPSQPHLARLIASESADLLQGDIPLFTARPDKCDLSTSRGEVIPAFFLTPSLSEVHKRLLQLDEDDLTRQTWIIRASFTTMATGADAAKKAPLLSSSDTPATRERLIAGARAVGEHLARLAIHNEDAVGWFNLMPARGSVDTWTLRPATMDLYGGNSGIALFLSYLGHITGETHYTALARTALKTIRYEISQIQKQSRFTEIGAFIGLGAPIYLFTHLGVLWNEPALLQEVQELVPLLSDLIEKDDELDIIAGSAGCIANLLSVYAVVPSASILAVAMQGGDHLLARAQTMKEGIGWRTRAYPQYPPTPGFAHGTAGIAWSLLSLAQASGEERFRHVALEALAYEHSLYSPEKQDWLMPPADAPAHSAQAEKEDGQRVAMSWTQGAPGIALSRLASLRYIDEVLIRDELAIALEKTLTEGIDRFQRFRPNHSLAHGYFGNLETLLVVAQESDEPRYREHLDRFTAMLLDSIDTHGWVTATPLNVETPGLMVGLAGIGYELLRLIEPERVPSVLLLAPPYTKKPRKDLSLPLIETAAEPLVRRRVEHGKD